MGVVLRIYDKAGMPLGADGSERGRRMRRGGQRGVRERVARGHNEAVGGKWATH